MAERGDLFGIPVANPITPITGNTSRGVREINPYDLSPPTEVTPMPVPNTGLPSVASPVVRQQRELDPYNLAPSNNPYQQGSPLDTLYGIDASSYLTDDQRKLARQIQGKFDASLNRRDRELGRYGAPRLSSFAEDESLARAMAAARGLNFREKEELPEEDLRPKPATFNGTRPIGNFGRTPDRPEEENDDGSTTANKWQRAITGLMSLAPLLFGKDAYGQFLNKGAVQWVKEKLFGAAQAATLSDGAFERILSTGGLYTTPTGTVIAMNPITGMPMGISPDAFSGDLPPELLDVSGGAGGISDIPWWEGGDYGGGVVGPPSDIPWWEGGDYGGDGGGFWFPGETFTPDDPFGIGGW